MYNIFIKIRLFNFYVLYCKKKNKYMLNKEEYNSVLYKEAIDNLKGQIEELERISAVSIRISTYLLQLELRNNIDVIKEIQLSKKQDGGCIFILNEINEKFYPHIYNALINIWDTQSNKTKEYISIMFSGTSSNIRTISVYWRSKNKYDFSTNDIAYIVEGN